MNGYDKLYIIFVTLVWHLSKTIGAFSGVIRRLNNLGFHNKTRRRCVRPVVIDLFILTFNIFFPFTQHKHAHIYHHGHVCPSRLITVHEVLIRQYERDALMLCTYIYNTTVISNGYYVAMMDIVLQYFSLEYWLYAINWTACRSNT